MKRIIYFPAVQRWGGVQGGGWGAAGDPFSSGLAPFSRGAGVGGHEGSAASGWAEHCKERGHGCALARPRAHQGRMGGCTRVHDDARVCTGMHEHARGCTTMYDDARAHKDAQACTGIRKRTRGYTGVQGCTAVHEGARGLQEDTEVCTGVHKGARVCTYAQACMRIPERAERTHERA